MLQIEMTIVGCFYSLCHIVWREAGGGVGFCVSAFSRPRRGGAQMVGWQQNLSPSLCMAQTECCSPARFKGDVGGGDGGGENLDWLSNYKR